jgi:multicomponent K+:H+ antiporter subunit D
MIAHSVILPIVLPAVTAGLLVLVSQRAAAVQRMGAVLALTALIVLAVYNLGQAGSSGPIPYFLGNWPAPFGIVLMLDRLSAVMLALTAGLAAAVMAYAIATGWDRRGKYFHALFMFQLMGLNGAFLTADAFNLFVFFEVLLIASYGLLVHGGGFDRMRAGVQYVAFNLVGSTVFLFGLATIYAISGTLNMADLAVKLPLMPPEDAALIRLASVLLFVVFAIKGALVPLQSWLPRSYAAAPAVVAALFAVMTKLGAYAMIRFGTLVFAPDMLAMDGLWGDLLFAGGLISIGLGALGVLAAARLAVMVGFATIGSMGVIFLTLSQFTETALVAALYYAVHSTLAAALLFLLVDMVVARRGQDALGTAGPRMAQSGLLAGLFMVAAIAMVGLPPLSGFVGKILVLQSLSSHASLAWSAVLAGSLITMIGFARAGSGLFWREDAAQKPIKLPPQPAAFAAVFALIAAIAALTVFAAPVTLWLNVAVADLISPSAYIGVQSLPQAVP